MAWFVKLRVFPAEKPRTGKNWRLFIFMTAVHKSRRRKEINESMVQRCSGRSHSWMRGQTLLSKRLSNDLSNPLATSIKWFKWCYKDRQKGLWGRMRGRKLLPIENVCRATAYNMWILFIEVPCDKLLWAQVRMVCTFSTYCSSSYSINIVLTF